MHKSKADAAQRQIRSLQSQLQSKQEQISLLESELADSVAQAEHEMSPAEQIWCHMLIWLHSISSYQLQTRFVRDAESGS